MEEDEETSDDSADYYGSIEAQRQENIYIVYLRRNGDMSDSEIIDATKKFAAIIQESDTYKEYLHQREKIKTKSTSTDRRILTYRMSRIVRNYLTEWKRLSRSTRSSERILLSVISCGQNLHLSE